MAEVEISTSQKAVRAERSDRVFSPWQNPYHGPDTWVTDGSDIFIEIVKVLTVL